jgi:hypothetical protein
MVETRDIPRTVKLFIGMLSRDPALFEKVNSELQTHYGPSDLESPVWKWEHSDYYSQEMGEGLKRRFFFYRKLIKPNHISHIKLKTIELEKQYLNENGGRRINLDPGYLDSSKVVLVTTKDYSHRIYLENGIYAEVTLIFSGKNYQILPFTYPDFRTQEYVDVFKKARGMYRAELEKCLSTGG